MTIGPTRVAPSVLDRMGVQPPPITERTFLAAFAASQAYLQELLEAKGSEVFIVPGTGTMGMEMVACSLVPPGAPVAVVSTGLWGDRWAAICHRVGMVVHLLRCRPGHAPDVRQVEDTVERESCRALLVTHVDSSSGVCLDIPPLAEVARLHGALLLTDGICAAGAEPVRQADWGVDVYLTSTPKALGVPAGLVLVAVRGRGLAALEERTWQPMSFSLDLSPWAPVMRDARRGLFHYWQSPAGNLVLALEEGLRLVLAEGIDRRIQRHAALAGRLREGLAALGIRLLTQDPAIQARGVTVCWHPEALAPDFLIAVRSHGVLLPAGTHPEVAGDTFRIGHLGNVTEADVDETLRALGKALGELRHRRQDVPRSRRVV